MQSLALYRSDLPDFLSEFTVPKAIEGSDRAYALYQLLLSAKRSQDYLFLGIGKVLKEIRDNKLYRELDYDSFNQFVTSDELGFSKESAFLYVRVYEYYIDRLGLSSDYVGRINLARLGQMIPLLKKIDDPEKEIEKVEELSALRQNDFLMMVRQDRGDDKPRIYFSKELEKWIVEIYSDRTVVTDLGEFAKYMTR